MTNEAKLAATLTSLEKIASAAKRGRDARNPVAKATCFGQILHEANCALREASNA